MARGYQLGVAASSHSEGTADEEDGCGSEGGADPRTQATSYMAGDRESIYTDFWSVLTDASYEA